MGRLLSPTPWGLYCERGDFYIDPWRKVDRALITHGHSDHARPGMRHYVCSHSSLAILQHRLGSHASIEAHPFGTPIEIGGVRVSFHPNGHILGSSQIRIEHRGEVWVMSGDYKRDEDYTCEAFEPVRCHTFITESTFGLPVYRWAPTATTQASMNNWWRMNQALGKVSIFMGYPLGKSQRILSMLEPSLGRIYLDKSAAIYTQIYESAGVRFPAYEVLNSSIFERGATLEPGAALILSSSSSGGLVNQIRRENKTSSAFISGWMQTRRSGRGNVSGHGFALSDHADWPALLKTIEETGAERIYVTHGYTETLARYLRETGRDAGVLPTHFERGEG